MERAPGPCLVCGETEREPLVRQGEWTVHRCVRCGLGVLDPRPGPDEIAALYRHGYYADRYGEGPAPGSEALRRRIAQEGHRIRFFRDLQPSGRILDLGCGRGYFLLAARERGYDVAGYDVSEDGASYAREVLRIPVRTGPLGEAAFQEAAYDLVTMWHSLEHAADPRASLDAARRALRPGGLLVVDVPNCEGTDARIMREAWDSWDLPHHLYHFTPAVLDALLAQQGFAVVRRKRYHSECVKARLRRVPVVGLLGRLVAKLFSGTSYAVVARKMPLRERS